MHGTDLTSLHALVNPEVLPIEYGGVNGNFNNKEWYVNLLSDEEYFKNQVKYGYKTEKDVDDN